MASQLKGLQVYIEVVFQVGDNTSTNPLVPQSKSLKRQARSGSRLRDQVEDGRRAWRMPIVLCPILALQQELRTTDQIGMESFISFRCRMIVST
jgi:hypothetical protein